MLLRALKNLLVELSVSSERISYSILYYGVKGAYVLVWEHFQRLPYLTFIHILHQLPISYYGRYSFMLFSLSLFRSYWLSIIFIASLQLFFTMDLPILCMGTDLFSGCFMPK